MLFLYSADVLKVVDGDTIDLRVDLGFRISTTIRTRLLGINAPEVSTEDGREARDWLRAMVPVGTKVTVSTHKDPRDKYGRWLARIEAPTVGDVSEMMIAAGRAVPFMV